MGRRKIEIQPITHERNRSVTFLKRRNGLFKKAYELGVLCSVDIAVIIFEERPGHSHKLFQYGSSNVQEILQRRLRYDGEMDSRGPNDFSGNTAAADIDEGDEDDVDEDPEDLLLSSSMRGGGSKRRGDGKLKSGIPMSATERLGGSMDYLPRSQPSPHLGISIPLQHQHSSSSSIPTSSDRLHPVHDSQSQSSHQHQSKKPRLGGSSGHTPHSPFSAGGHLSPRTSALDRSSGGEGSSGYRNLPSSSSQHPPQSFGQRPSSSSSSYSQYPPFFQSSQGHHSPPTPSFIPLQPEFSLSSTSRSRGRSTSGTGGAPYIPRTSGYEGGYPSRPGGGGGGGGDLFASLDSGRGRSGGGFGLDWPVHSQQPPPPPPPGAAPPRIIAGAPGDGGPGQGIGGGGGSGGGTTDISRTNSGADSTSTADWLDFLSGAGNGVPPPPGSSSTSSKSSAPAHVVGGRPPSSGGQT